MFYNKMINNNHDIFIIIFGLKLLNGVTKGCSHVVIQIEMSAVADFIIYYSKESVINIK